MAELTPAHIWTRTLQDLQLQTTRATFDTWLRGTYVVSEADGEYTIGVRHTYAQDWLRNRMEGLIIRALRQHAGPSASLRFIVHQPNLAPPDPIPDLEDEPLVEAVREQRVSVRQDGTSLAWTDFYIKLKVAFRRRALANLKGAKLSVFLCLALHVDRDGIAFPGIETIMQETGYSRSVVCSALDELVRLGLISKLSSPRSGGTDEYQVNGYAWFGNTPAPALWEAK